MWYLEYQNRQLGQFSRKQLPCCEDCPKEKALEIAKKELSKLKKLKFLIHAMPPFQLVRVECNLKL